MKQTYTNNKLVQLLYGECDLFERLETEDAIENDFLLSEEFAVLKQSKRSLPKVSFIPKTSSINAILEYSSKRLEYC